MKAVAIIQARVSSSRLHSKALMELGGKPMIFHVIERSKLIKGIQRVILATGENESNLPLAGIARDCGIELFRGSEENVLDRFYHALHNSGCDYIIRITGDNPLTDFKSASEALDLAANQNAHHCYVSGIPIGTGVEIISYDALCMAYHSAGEGHHFEHVTPYIKEHPELFKLLKYTSLINNPFPDLRLTVDTIEDMQLMKKIYDSLYSGRPILLEDVIAFIAGDPELIKINSHVLQRPMTHHSNSNG
jgi:spore coat polysaccharide biosynthesis protein SpsF